MDKARIYDVLKQGKESAKIKLKGAVAYFKSNPKEFFIVLFCLFVLLQLASINNAINNLDFYIPDPLDVQITNTPWVRIDN